MSDAMRYGVIARFDTGEALLRATRAAREAGFDNLDAYAPFPVPGLAEALGFKERRLAPLAFVGGLIGASAAFFIQWYSATIDYPYAVGGKPLNSWPAFLPITFEVGVLSAVLVAVVGMLIGNGLPRPHHPVFNWKAFERASKDGFFLLIRGGGPEAVQFLESQTPAAVQEVGP